MKKMILPKEKAMLGGAETIQISQLTFMVATPSIVFGGITLITLLGVGITDMAMVMFGDTDSIITTVGIDRYGSTMAGAGAGAGTVLIGTQVITTVHTTETVTTTAIMKVPIKDALYHTIEQDAAQ